MVAIFTGLGAGLARGSGNLLGGAGQLGGSLLGRGGEGVSVNAATGNLLISHQDEFLVGLGPDVAIARSYNSLGDAGDGDNGDSWQQNTTRKVVGYNAGVSVQRLGADGSLITYSWVSGNLYRTKDGAGAFDTLEYNSGSDSWTWTDGDSQAKEVYGAAQAAGEYRISSAADIDGNALTFTYVAGTDKLDKVSTADGSWTQYSWSGNAIAQVATGYTDLGTSTAKTLTRVLYAYDGQGRLATVTTDLTPGDSSVADGANYVTTYTYDGTSNRVASIAQSDGSLLQIAYDGSNRVQTLTQTVASGVTRVTTLTYGTGYTTVTGPDGQATRLDYDASNRLTKVTAPAAYSGATAQTVQFSYDADGNLDTVTDGNGKITSYDYDTNGNATLVTDATGNTITRTYDAQNRLITELTTGADRDGASVAHYQHYVYDSEGHLRFAVDAAGQTTEYRYDTAGQLVRTIQYVEQRMTPPGAAAIDEATAMAWAAAITDRGSARVTENSYDARGNLIQSKAYGIADSSGNPLTAEGTTTANFVYDQMGNLLERYRPGEAHETFLYDGMGRLYSSTDKNGGTTTIVFADSATTTTVTTALGLTTTSVYNKAGDLVSYAESGASTTAGTATSYYDAAGRLRKVVDASGREAYFYYDKAGRKVAEVNQLGELTEYRYDAAGRVAASIAYSAALAGTPLTNMQNLAYTGDLSTMLPTASANDVWSWTVYDDAGRAIQVIDNLGSTVTYAYDTEGKLAKTYAYFTKLSAGTLTGFKTTFPASLQLPATNAKDTFSRVFYDKAGQQIAVLDGEGYLTESIRDGAGLVVQTTSYAAVTNAGDRASGTLATLKAGIAASTADRVGYSVYDGQGLLRYSVNARGGITGFTYDDAGRLIKTTVYATELALTDFTYDAVKAAVTTNAADRTSWVVYDGAGRAAYTLDAEGGVIAFAYNSAGQVVKVIAYDNLYAASVDLASLTAWSTNTSQANDTANRLTRTWYNARGEAVYSIDAEKYVTGYAYDAEGRVLSTTRYGGSGVTVGDTTTIAQLETLLSSITASNRITVSTSYDNAGRVLTVTTPLDDSTSTVTRNTYNALGQLTDVTEAYASSDAAITHYTYDGAGRVLTVTGAYGASEAATVTYAYDGLGNQTSATDARGNAVTYTYDKLGQLLTATNALSGVTTYVYDAFGNVVKVTTPAGASTYNYYDRLDRLVTVRDAANYVVQTIYNRFGEIVAVKRFAEKLTGTPQIGVNPTGDPDAPANGQSPAVIAAYAYAASLQETADDAQAALVAAQSAYNTALSNSLVWFQNYLTDLQAQYTPLSAALESGIADYDQNVQHQNANWWDRFREGKEDTSSATLNALRDQALDVADQIEVVEDAIDRLDRGRPLQNDHLDVIENYYDLPALEDAAEDAQDLADHALADAQALEAQETGDLGDYSGFTQTYDRLGRLATKIDAEGYGERYAYNAFGDLVGFRRYPGAITGSTYDETLFEYDHRSSLTKTTDAQLWIEQYGYDAFGRRISLTAKNETAAKAASGVTTYEYYKNGLLKSETLPIQSQSNAGANMGAIKTSYLYDSRGNLTRTTEADGLAEQRVTTYTYDKLGRKLTTAGAAITGVKIDASTKAVSADNGSPTETITYDANGNIIKLVDAAGARTVFFYDQLNRKTVEINALGTYTLYAYDADGNVTNIRIYETAVAVPATGGASSSQPAAPSGNKRETSFTYDNLGRMLTSSVVLPAAYKTGVWNGTAWTNATTASLDTAYQYDYLGNVVKVTDPGGNATFSYYDRLGRKTAQLDTEGYLTSWSYNSEGNVTNERRYNTRFTGTATTASAPTVSTNAADRVTDYTYDKVGNRLTETRSGVLVANAAFTSVTAQAVTVTYSYNGLGQVLTRQEATGDTFTYAYDKGGRLTQEKRPQYASNNGANVIPEVDYYYDGLGNVTRTVQLGGGEAAAVSRVTTYSYGAGGRLSSMTDAAGAVTSYLYDVAGRLVLEYYTRTITPASGSATTSVEGIGYRYDALGRSLGQAYYAKPASTWTFQSANEYTTIAYDAFGDVTGTATNRSAADIASKGYQQEFKYDLAGRLWASNQGDGLWKYYGYDKNGNQTLLIEGAGETMTGLTLATAFPKIGQANVNATYTVFDKRNQATSAVQEGRELTATLTQNLTTSRSYNAFGEVATETDALGYTTSYSYNTMGKVIRKESPTVSMTLADGTSRYIRPSEDYYYDKSGRLIATRDANGTYATGGTATAGTSKAANTGNLNQLTLLAGTGYGGSEALVALETHADGGTVANKYNIFGDLRAVDRSTGTATLTTAQTFDALGQVVTYTDAGGATWTYAYDELGRQVKNYNSLYGATDAEITVYDIQGRITAQRSLGGDVTTTSYAWDDTSATDAIGNFGGWIRTVAGDSGSYTATYETDLFGRDADAAKTYDAAGRLITDGGINLTATTDDQTFTYYNTGLLKGKTVANSFAMPSKQYSFGYDALGRLKTEKTVESVVVWALVQFPPPPAGDGQIHPVASVGPVSFEDSEVEYDALGRMIEWTGGVSLPNPTTKTWTYDAQGNIRSVVMSGAASQNYWYTYDAMNRETLSQGALSGGAIVAGTAGIALGYDQADRRISSRTGAGLQETYTLNAMGLVTEVKIGGVTRSTSSYDILGRLDGYVENSASGALVYERFAFSYNSRGQVLSEKARQLQGSNWIYSHTANYYNDTGFVTGTTTVPPVLTGAAGTGSSTGMQLYYSQTKNWSNGTTVGGTGVPAYGGSNDTAMGDYSSKNWVSFSERYGWQQTKQDFVNQYGTGTSAYQYDAEGFLHKVDRTITGSALAEDVYFANDINGLVLRRWEERDPGYAAGAVLPSVTTYRFGGKEMGTVGNNGTTNVDYATLIDRRDDVQGSGRFLGGATTASAYSNFDANLVTLAGGAQDNVPGSWTVRAGDTLQSIALASWGDASQWYKIALANGLAGSGAIAEGQTLVIPGAVGNIHNNADTLKPYDPARALGDVSPPGAKPPPQKRGCGMLGVLILTAIAIGVAVLIGPEIVPALQTAFGTVGGAVVGGAIAGAAGSMVSQTFGVATGLQDSFSWKGVGLAALGGAIGGGLKGLGDLANMGKLGGAAGDAAQFLNGQGLLNGLVRGAVSSAATQGLAVATHLQDSFDWAGVAAASIGGGIGDWVGNRTVNFGNFGSDLASTTAGAIANAATRSAINGESFGANLKAAIPDAIGQAIGRALGRGLGGAIKPSDAKVATDPNVQEPKAQVDAQPSASNAVTSADIEVIRLKDDPFTFDRYGLTDWFSSSFRDEMAQFALYGAGGGAASGTAATSSGDYFSNVANQIVTPENQCQLNMIEASLDTYQTSHIAKYGEGYVDYQWQKENIVAWRKQLPACGSDILVTADRFLDNDETYIPILDDVIGFTDYLSTKIGEFERIYAKTSENILAYGGGGGWLIAANVSVGFLSGIGTLVTSAPGAIRHFDTRVLKPIAEGLDAMFLDNRSPGEIYGDLKRNVHSLSLVSQTDTEIFFGEVAPIFLTDGVGTVGSRLLGNWGAAEDIAAAHPLAGLAPSDVVDMAAARGLQTPRDSLILWSGLGRDGAVRAQAFAQEFGGTTLEMTPGGKWLDSMDLYGSSSPFTSAEADEIWGQVSGRMVGQASGQVRSVLGQVRPMSVYNRYELPALRENSQILGLDPLQVRPMIKASGY